MTSKKSSYDKHIATLKHKNRTELNFLEPKSCSLEFVCKKCNKSYKARNSLWYHLQKCNGNEMSEPITTNETMFEMIIKDNSDFKNLMLEMMKTNEELQNKMLDICKNGNIQNNTLMGGDASASQGQSTSAQ